MTEDLVSDYPQDDELLALLRDARPRPEVTLAFAATSPQAQALYERITAQPPADPGHARAKRPSRRPARRMTRRVPLAIAAAAVVMALAVTGGLALSAGGGGPQEQALRPGSVVSSAYLVAKMTAATGQISNDITYMHTTNSTGGSFRIWDNGTYRPARTIYSLNGRTCYDIAETATQITVVDYANHTWWVQPNPQAKIRIPKFGGCHLTGFVALVNPVPTMASMNAWLRQSVSQGYYTVGRIGVIDGQRALSLTFVPGPGSQAREHLWVNASSYLPLLDTVTFPSLHYTSQSRTSYLPPTQANLAQLTVSIPAGFRHVQPSSAGS